MCMQSNQKHLSKADTLEFFSKMALTFKNQMSTENFLEVLRSTTISAKLASIAAILREKICLGQPLAQAMAETGAFDCIARNVVTYGEAIGHSTQAAQDYAENLREELNQNTKNCENALPLAVVAISALAGVLIGAFVARRK